MVTRNCLALHGETPTARYPAATPTKRTPVECIVERTAKPTGSAGLREAEPGRTRFARLETEGCSETEIGPSASLRVWAPRPNAFEGKKAPNGSLISGSLQDNGGGRGLFDKLARSMPHIAPARFRIRK